LKKIDVHCHILPVEAFGKAGRWGPELYQEGGKTWLRSGKSRFALTAGMSAEVLCDPTARLGDMDRKGIDIHVVSSAPTFYFYQIDHDLAIYWATECNKAMALWPQKEPRRYRFFANLPLGDIQASLLEVDRARELGAVGFSMGAPSVSRSLDDEYFYPLYEKLNELDMPIFVHPVQPGIDTDKEGDAEDPALDFSKVGNVLRARAGVLHEETLTIASLISSGTFDHFPNLKFCIPHAGGGFALHWERFEETADKHPAGKRTRKRFRDYMGHFYVDSIVHDPRGREFVVSVMGADNVVVGSNYGGWDAFDGFAAIEELNISRDDKAKIMGGNLARILHID
jgi:aminocarboxymuconate-semialdehyde decarboxylase